MSQQYKQKLQEYENSQEFQAVPKYPNKEPIKEVEKHNQGVLNSFQNAHKKNFQTNFKILEKHLLILKGKTNSFLDSYNYIQNHFQELDQKKQQLEKVKKQTRQVEKLRDQMEDQKRQVQIKQEDKVANDKLASQDKVNDLEKTLSGRENEVFKIIQKMDIAKKTNEHLIKSKKDIEQQIQQNINDMDNNFQQKRQQVDEFIQKQKESVDDFEKQLKQMKDIPNKKEQEKKFQEQYKERADIVIGYASKYENMIDDTFADLKKVKKLSEKLAIKNNRQNNQKIKELSKVQQLNKQVWNYIAINEGYRAKISQEEKRQKILHKMANDLDAKIKELTE